MDERSQVYLNTYLNSLPNEIAKQHSSFSADYFCSDEYNANVCADLILRGEKRASCSMAHWYTHEGEAMPEVGHLQVVTNWNGDPICIIEITSIRQCKYSEITADFAAEEGEGDKSLEWWKEAHWAFFRLECEELGIELNEDILLILEHFKVVYK
ncbi:ASCH domain-containing protein [Marinomonas algicola]|uniref:ASCH domain-containing protein n=1 Tax=Marinomonas algicola TaxID=2773454 RepID=UPI001749E502|nr:ASCH domain-containing protein [Marinomonas algicola]